MGVNFEQWSAKAESGVVNAGLGAQATGDGQVNTVLPPQRLGLVDRESRGLSAGGPSAVGTIAVKEEPTRKGVSLLNDTASEIDKTATNFHNAGNPLGQFQGDSFKALWDILDEAGRLLSGFSESVRGEGSGISTAVKDLVKTDADAAAAIREGR
ncbi:hypothetical protein GA0061078_1228 [Bifidobacterium bohemicum]|uniref:Uncharacterized protein n=1 Tax=Bifidobacterium bohemicum DSM 22767 TaxID=1437606 RepID=A0A086ZG78_9BIFI|nr:hypothetical protein [Bifidobacterium bohemicum]KFI45528.1 hypothetical protein BBOH_1061 [Bifidobacterium bohemicum DSM 22767]SCC02819.1 hypothetical protein GA0061078_1228 [Bifidobacterium bohemicum]